MSEHPPFGRTGHDRRADLIRISIDVFGESGFAGGRIDEIARRAGIRRPSVLYHFSDKRSLYAAAIAGVVREISDRVVATEGQPAERLEAIADTWVDFVIDRPNAARLLLRQMIDVEPIPVRDSEAPVRELLASIQAAIDDRTAPVGSKAIEASELALILSSTSLVWVASRSAVEGALGLDTLSPESIQRHRRTLHALIRQWLAAASEATDAKHFVMHPSHLEAAAGRLDEPASAQRVEKALRSK